GALCGGKLQSREERLCDRGRRFRQGSREQAKVGGADLQHWRLFFPAPPVRQAHYSCGRWRGRRACRPACKVLSCAGLYLEGRKFAARGEIGAWIPSCGSAKVQLSEALAGPLLAGPDV